jgi:hypothetical protein
VLTSRSAIGKFCTTSFDKNPMIAHQPLQAAVDSMSSATRGRREYHPVQKRQEESTQQGYFI